MLGVVGYRGIGGSIIRATFEFDDTGQNTLPPGAAGIRGGRPAVIERTDVRRSADLEGGDDRRAIGEAVGLDGGSEGGIGAGPIWTNVSGWVALAGSNAKATRKANRAIRRRGQASVYNVYLSASLLWCGA